MTLVVLCAAAIVGQVLAAIVRGFLEGLDAQTPPLRHPMLAGYRAGRWIRRRRDQLVDDALTDTRSEETP